jgi:class 3 adenylate cyclase
VWLAAIALAVLKATRATEGLKVNPRLAGLLRDEQLHGVIDHFVRLLDFTPSDLQRCATDTDGHLVPRLRLVKTPVVIFIDGIDEYFNKHVEELPINPSVTGELSPQVWYFAQLGLVEVAYQLRRINHHLKVFAAVRKEAYASLPRRTAMAQQYRGSAVDIVYLPQSLREIFVNNIRLVKSERMVRPSRARAHPLEAFLGRSTVGDPYTREEEDALEYLCRHTLLRPRDLMTIGERLVALRPEERLHEHRLKEAVHQAAAEIARKYLAEVAPYVGELDLEGLLARLPGPVLTRAEVEALDAGDGNPDTARRMLWALHRVGLLGHVQHDRARGQQRQRFLRPGEATLEPDGTLPASSHYLVHPVLSDLIGRDVAPAPRALPTQAIGYDRPWRDDSGAAPSDVALHERVCCVLKADVHGFAALMRAGADQPVRTALDEAVRRWAPPGAIAEARAGDAVLIVCDDPIALARAARHLIDDVYQAAGQPRLRVALHYGAVATRQRHAEAPHEVAGGDAVLCAARVEPLVEPGQIWATDEFRQQLAPAPVVVAHGGIAGRRCRRPRRRCQARRAGVAAVGAAVPGGVLSNRGAANDRDRATVKRSSGPIHRDHATRAPNRGRAATGAPRAARPSSRRLPPAATLRRLNHPPARFGRVCLAAPIVPASSPPTGARQAARRHRAVRNLRRRRARQPRVAPAPAPARAGMRPTGRRARSAACCRCAGRAAHTTAWRAGPSRAARSWRAERLRFARSSCRQSGGAASMKRQSDRRQPSRT